LKALEEQNITVPTISIAKREEEVIVHATRSHIATDTLEAFRTGAKQENGMLVERSGDYYVLNLHAGQTNASGHSKNLRGSNSGPARYSHVTKLFQRIRDESHRFAVSYHTVLKRTKQTASSLEEIPGIGPATRKKLIRQFGSLRGLKDAEPDELIAAVGNAKAALLTRYLQG
jgi:excinuclease ABC subunit C